MVTVGPFTLPEVADATDRDTMEALEQARRYRDQDPGAIRSAIVTRRDGLVLLRGQLAERTSSGMHLRTPLCGYDGTGPRAAAEILALCGFGTEAELRYQVTSGDLHTFRR